MRRINTYLSILLIIILLSAISVSLEYITGIDGLFFMIPIGFILGWNHDRLYSFIDKTIHKKKK